MPKAMRGICLFAALALCAHAAQALEFRTAAKHGVVLYEAPSEKGRKLFTLSRATPLEVLVEQGDWLRVRDHKGSIAWIKKKDASAQRHLQVIKAGSVHREASAKSAVVFKTEPDLLLEMLENTKTGWLKVKHRDGLTGFVRIEEIWGL
ncbi:SH3 domain-containing protein [Formivibrio citricus]|uniref:SH3 domain-containing protein n=1 Tax=Formivibrio citricus TaxID=83765 RepID=A0A1I4Z733_9NEIS|nr:SH3 domain-containing protein [Formivibrio citricus]SFN45799.1 SH3 domain-containing protein [Formivibrio citricus]